MKLAISPLSSIRLIGLITIVNYLIQAALAGPCGHQLTVTPNIDIPQSESDQEIQQSISVKRENFFPLTCAQYFITFSKGASSTYDRTLSGPQNYRLPYNLYKQQGQVTTLKGIDAAPDFSGYLSGYASLANIADTQNFYLFFRKPYTSPTIAHAGNYFDSIILTVYSGWPTAVYNYESSATITYRTAIPSKIDISLVSPGNLFDPNATSYLMDFGELQQNATLTAQMKLVSNAGISVFASSYNNGRLKNMSSSDTVRYTFKVNGQDYNLNSSSGNPKEIARVAGTTSPGGLSYDLEVVIGNINNKGNGEYRDYITLTAATIE